jgi:probable sporulation protein (polysaccharide deacetylase family)
MLCLVACFALLLAMYSYNFAATAVFPWGGKQVNFMGHVLDTDASDLEEQITRLTEALMQSAINAEYDSINLSVIPDVNGFEIDVAATADSIRSARKGTNITPVWKEITAESTLKDFPHLPVYQGNPVKNQVALVINVSWGNEYLEEMLDILEQESVLASFFLVGRWAEQNPDLVRKIHSFGHDFGNHGYSDPHMKDLSPEAIKDEIVKTNQIVEGATGYTIKWFSPPYGEKVEKIYVTAAELGLHTVLWSLDTIDWTLPGEDVMVERIVNNLHSGAIILMHPKPVTVKALPALISHLKQEGYAIVLLKDIVAAH